MNLDYTRERPPESRAVARREDSVGAWGDRKYNVSRLIEGDIHMKTVEVRLLVAG